VGKRDILVALETAALPKGSDWVCVDYQYDGLGCKKQVIQHAPGLEPGRCAELPNGLGFR